MAPAPFLRWPMTAVNRRWGSTALAVFALVVVGLFLRHDRLYVPQPAAPAPAPAQKPKEKNLPPPIRDPFPLLSHSPPPAIPKWNVAPPDLYRTHNLPVAPPLFVGFTRSWPMLLQCVVSYITAGWPADQIYVIENTGVHDANVRGQLTLQNPFYLNHTQLKMLGVNIVRTPVLLSFAQLQNFFHSLSLEHSWPYYFWSHMDVLALSFEEGHSLEDGKEVTPGAEQPGYQSLYALALKELAKAQAEDNHWGVRFFSYDHLALVNPAAMADVGDWDTLIPYYMTDCDMHDKLAMRGWTAHTALAGTIHDISTTLDDLVALYRDPSVSPNFTPLNPDTGSWELFGRSENSEKVKRGAAAPVREAIEEARDEAATNDTSVGEPRQAGQHARSTSLEYFQAIRKTAEEMTKYKRTESWRNSWHLQQHGGQGEPYYYDVLGLVQGIEQLTKAGREVFRLKWGHADCGVAGRKFEDQWTFDVHS